MLGLLVHLPGLGLVPISVLIAAPIAIPILWTASRPVKQLALWTGVALLTGSIALWTSTVAGLHGPTFDTWAPIVLWVAAIPLLPALAEWALKRVAPRIGILLMLTGGIISTILLYGIEWKGTLGIFVTAFVLILLARRPLLSFITLAVVLAFSAVNDARSMAVAAGLALVILYALRTRQKRDNWVGRTFRVVFTVAMFAFIGLWALSSGLLGEEVQARTVDQLGKSNILFGARAEWAATLSLVPQQPWGFGTGVQPSAAQTTDAIDSVQQAGGDWTSNYFSTIVFGERVDLHSTTANLWFHFGIGGVIVALLVGVILFRGIRDSGVSTKLLGMGGIYLMLMGAWDLLFSPMADVSRLVAGIVVALTVTAMRASDDQYPTGTKPMMIAAASTKAHAHTTP